MDSPSAVGWAFVVELFVVLTVAFFWQWSDDLPFAEWLASWVLPALVLGWVASVSVPRSRGAALGARWIGLTLVLGACGAAINCTAMTFIMLLSVIRTGMSWSWVDILGTLSIGVPVGAWIGAVVGLFSGAVLATVVVLVERLRPLPLPDVPAPGREAALVAGVSIGVLALVVELQHHVPAFMIQDCPSGCSAWTVTPWARVLASVLAVGLLVGGDGLLAMSHHWIRTGAGVALVALSWVTLATGNVVISTTFEPRFRRASMGLPSIGLPVQRNLVGAEVVSHPGVLWHSLEFRWEGGVTETVLIGVGPFRPDTDGLTGAFRDAIEEWNAAAVPLNDEPQ
ncbi:MAG: hypothetical protein ACI9MC_000525 [Kiritimatiellia bacterium]|jgi:hypothetical protein